MADETGDSLDLEDPNGIDVRFMAAYRAWYMAALATHQASQEGNLVTVLGAAPAELSWAVELDTTWQALAGDAYRTARDATDSAPVLAALRAVRDSWGLLAGLHLCEDEAASAAEAVRWRPVGELPPAADPTVAPAYAEHLQGLSLSETTTALARLFLHTPQVLTGKLTPSSGRSSAGQPLLISLVCSRAGRRPWRIERQAVAPAAAPQTCP
ncbi:hypothetical protein [Nocardiopsis aegyptia]|uniref:Uncharacterized protein n=1 Tax=Nocardiopsis aegyptia TaxID=220378 RepID=A0A7Z0EKB9_9ACTN|nr:hypothetical protein [Nocardiopsis aegyptia]NYJ32830.1 hypothetical protein [Nocardiopsis aegyptia]